LFDEVEEASGPASDVNEPQFALITPGESFRKWQQCLTPHGVSCSPEQHLNLRVITIGGFLRQPTTRLEMEILQVVVWAAAACLFSEHVMRAVALATLVDLGQVAEEKQRPLYQCAQCAVMVLRKRIDARLNIHEILVEQRRDVGVQPLMDDPVGLRLRATGPIILSYLSGKLPHDLKMTRIPSHAGQLPSTVGDARGQP